MLCIDGKRPKVAFIQYSFFGKIMKPGLAFILGPTSLWAVDSKAVSCHHHVYYFTYAWMFMNKNCHDETFAASISTRCQLLDCNAITQHHSVAAVSRSDKKVSWQKWHKRHIKCRENVHSFKIRRILLWFFFFIRPPALLRKEGLKRNRLIHWSLKLHPDFFPFM